MAEGLVDVAQDDDGPGFGGRHGGGIAGANGTGERHWSTA